MVALVAHVEVADRQRCARGLLDALAVLVAAALELALRVRHALGEALLDAVAGLLGRSRYTFSASEQPRYPS